MASRARAETTVTRSPSAARRRAGAGLVEVPEEGVDVPAALEQEESFHGAELRASGGGERPIVVGEGLLVRVGGPRRRRGPACVRRRRTPRFRLEVVAGEDRRQL